MPFPVYQTSGIVNFTEKVKYTLDDFSSLPGELECLIFPRDRCAENTEPAKDYPAWPAKRGHTMHSVSGLSLKPDLQVHPGYSRVFQPGKLTFGFIMPLEGYPDSPFPVLENHQQLAGLADDMGFSALWTRDIPFYDPSFGDTGQAFDPMVYLGFLAAATRRIALGTAGIVLPLRDPLIVAKQAVSVDQLSNGRLILGLSSGDRPSEYPAFGADFDNRAERFREAVSLIHGVTTDAFPRIKTRHYGRLTGNLNMVPRPRHSRLPTIIVGRAQQDIDWLAENSDGWIWHRGSFSHLPDIIRAWRESSPDTYFHPYGYGTFFDLSDDPDEPVRQNWGGIRAGRNALIEFWKKHEAVGVNHVALNLKPLQRPAEEVLHELAEYVLPHFSPAHRSQA